MRAVRVLTLVLVWLALWSDISVANVASGVLLASVVVSVFESGRQGKVVLRPMHAARLALYFLYKLVQASVVVARTVVTPKRRLHTGIVAVPLSDCSDAVATLVADAISLTPGTLTLEVRHEPLTLFVHALDVRDVERVRADVRTLEILTIRAFGSSAAVAALDVDDTASWESR